MLVNRQWMCAAGLIGVVGAASADDVFRVTATVGAEVVSAGYATVQQTFDALTEANLKQFVPGYTGVEAADVKIDFRGLAMSTAYPIANNPRLDLDIPAVDISESFVGATREESRQMLRDYFKNGDALGRIMKELAASSPVDPIAGNPTSLQTSMVSGSYDRHFRVLATVLAGRSLGREPRASRPLWLASAGGEVPALGAQANDLDTRANAMAEVDLARYTGAGITSEVVSLPFGHAFDTAPERPLSIDGELQYSHTQGARSWGGNLGLAYRQRVNRDWYLVPSASVGFTAAEDLGSTGTILSAALTSAYRLAERADYVLWMGNAVNVVRTVNTTVGDYSFDSDVHNVAFTNGVVLSLTPSMLKSQWLEVSFADTRYTGSDLYDERYDELGVAIVWARRTGGGPATMRAELSYLDTTNTKGWGLKFQATF